MFLGYAHVGSFIGFAVDFRLFFCWLFVCLGLFGLLVCILVCVLLFVDWRIVGGIVVAFVILRVCCLLFNC